MCPEQLHQVEQTENRFEHERVKGSIELESGVTSEHRADTRKAAQHERRRPHVSFDTLALLLRAWKMARDVSWNKINTKISSSNGDLRF